ncbi:polysaccharide deacetylase family protein [Paenibacillus agilis]|uniref:Polysaccharide deacetylase family protein n=1 Tax=Paenibacillus agilis TaxID=3020863 RepID=A0A559J4C5_9BACL|nr:polysaccharide deacetylase family protein [Paenibacillus agilis]TVX94733.1 polysaccharide deacetylase family protein [Paenibacillus agilis]
MTLLNATKQKWIVVGFACIITWVIVDWTGASKYVAEHKAQLANSDAFQMSSNLDEVNGDELRQRIKRAAEEQREAPINARIDRVWKAVPGYNGLEVDEAASYEQSSKLPKGAPLKLVYRETKAEVTLADLPIEPIYRGNENKPMVAFMINVAWGNEHIEPILKTLKEYQVKTTFFLDGSWVRRNPELAKRLTEEGHEIGNHAYTHPNMAQLSEGRQYVEIEKTEREIEKQLGKRSSWFAPPSGSFNSLTVKTAQQLKMLTVLWSADTIDWNTPNEPGTIIQRVKPKLKPGVLVLMHPTAATSKALPTFIRMARENKLEPGTVSEVLSEKRVLPNQLGNKLR